MEWRAMFVRCFLLPWCFLPCAAAGAADYFVRPTGQDDGPGSAVAPFATIGHALNLLEPGDTLFIGAGVYEEGDFYPEVSGTPDAPITVRNIPGESPIADGGRVFWNFVELIEQDGFVFEGLTLRNYRSAGISCRHVGHVTIRGCTAHGNGSGGFELNHASYPHADYDAHITIEGCISYENGWLNGWSSGIHLNNKSEGGAHSHHVIRRNICFNNFDGSGYHTDGNGIMFDMGGGGSALIENNLCYNNGGAGIRVMDGHAQVTHNTCFRNGWDPYNPYQPPEIEIIDRHLSGATGGTVVYNNLLWSRSPRETDGAPYGGPFGLDDAPVDAIEFGHNVLWSDTPASLVLASWMIQCTIAEPVFVQAPLADEAQQLNGALFLEMDGDDYDFRLAPESPGVALADPAYAPGDDLSREARDDAPDAGAYEYTAFPGAAAELAFGGAISRAALEGYLSRAITMSDMLLPRMDSYREDQMRMIRETGARFLGRAVFVHGAEAGAPALLARLPGLVSAIHSQDERVIVQAAIFEFVTREVEQVPVPPWVFEAFGETPEARTFDFGAMGFGCMEPQFWQEAPVDAQVPDWAQPETQRWVYYLAASYIDAGIEAIHLGQLEWVSECTSSLTETDQLIARIRAHARAHARRGYVLLDAHTHGMAVDGRLLLDFHSYPLRIQEGSEAPEGVLEVGVQDAIYGRSLGGVHPSGWVCEHAPYLVEFDHGYAGETPGACGQPECIWGYDEVSWLAYLPGNARDEWLHHAWDWVRSNDPNGWLQMVGSRDIQGAAPNGSDWYFANSPEHMALGFGQDAAIAQIWSGAIMELEGEGEGEGEEEGEGEPAGLEGEGEEEAQQEGEGEPAGLEGEGEEQTQEGEAAPAAGCAAGGRAMAARHGLGDSWLFALASLVLVGCSGYKRGG